MLRERSGGGGVVFERFLLGRERERELKRATDDEKNESSARKSFSYFPHKRDRIKNYYI